MMANERRRWRVDRCVVRVIPDNKSSNPRITPITQIRTGSNLESGLEVLYHLRNLRIPSFSISVPNSRGSNPPLAIPDSR